VRTVSVTRLGSTPPQRDSRRSPLRDLHRSLRGGLRATPGHLSLGRLADATLNAPQSFEIVVNGRLSPTLIAGRSRIRGQPVRLWRNPLVGWVPDQAALHGTLEMLRDLNIELISVNPKLA
jgi:hypothetical protein